jgi:hypothetical protein
MDQGEEVMTLLHRIVGALPRPLAESIERESRCWKMRCPHCGSERSVWDLDGIRWKACGNPRRLNHCTQCGKNVWSKLYYRGESEQAAYVAPAYTEQTSRPAATDTENATGREVNSINPSPRTEPMPSARLWIDGVGCWLAWWHSRLTIGGPSTRHAADLSLLANLASLHCAIERCGEEYVVHPQGPTSIKEKIISSPSPLIDGDELRLGDDVRLRFRLPSSLSTSAVLEFVSDHRPSQRTDGIVLMDQTCLIGPGSDQHIRCRRAEDSVVVFRRDDALWVRSRKPLQVNGKQSGGPVRLSSGDVVRDEALSFRLELEGDGPGTRA